MHLFFRVLFLTIISLSSFAQNKLDPFQVYGPYGAKVYEDFSQALLNANDCYRLKSLNEDLSKNLKKIKKLDKLYVIEFKSNNIDSFPEEISSFRNLMYLKSSGKSLKKLSESFGFTLTLKTLVLHHVKMDSMPDSFNKLGSLMELEIQVNNADTFKLKNSLNGLYNLKSLMLYKTNLPEFPVGLDKSPKLKKVLMVDCGLTQIDSSFAFSRGIQTLILDKNKFKEFPSELIQIETLKELSLRNNQITHLPEKVAYIRGLEILDLTGNNIPPIELDILRVLLPHCKIIH